MDRRRCAEPTPLACRRGGRRSHARHHEAVPGRGRQRRRRLRGRGRRGARAARRERRRQVDAVEHPHRPLPARRGRDRALRRAGRSSTRPRDALDAGIGMVHQHFRLVEPFTVAENIVLGDRRGSARLRRSTARDRAAGRRAGRALRPRRSTPTPAIWQLSVGEQQRVEILKALYRDARVLILDEPTAVLTPQEADGAVRDAAARWPPRAGRSVFISHKLDEVMAVADRVTVLRGGRDGRRPSTTAGHDAARRSPRLMVGREVVLRAARERDGGVGRRRARASTALRPTATAAATRCTSVSLARARRRDRRRRGRRGQRPARARRGDRRHARRRTAATVRVGGRGAAGRRPAGGDRRRRRPRARGPAAHGVAPSLQHRREPGAQVVPATDVSRARSCGSAASASRADRADRALRRARRPARDDARPAAVGRQRAEGGARPRVLGRPAGARRRRRRRAGLDVGAIETVRGYLREAADRGVGVLLISEDLDEMLALADRIVGDVRGRVVGEVDAGVADVERARAADGRRGSGPRRRVIRRSDRAAPRQPRWLTVAVPSARSSRRSSRSRVVLARAPGTTRRHLPPDLRARATSPTGALDERSIAATPLLFTGLAAAVAFRMGCSTSAARASSTSARSAAPASALLARRPAGAASRSPR